LRLRARVASVQRSAGLLRAQQPIKRGFAPPSGGCASSPTAVRLLVLLVGLRLATDVV
jgi:hypothetical protein